MGNPKYKIGDKWGHLTILEKISHPYKGSEKNRKTTTKLKCRCDCGSVFEYCPSNIFGKKSTSCKHCQNLKDATGKKIGCIKILGKISNSNNGKILYKCVCKCGFKFCRDWTNIRNRTWIRCPGCPRKKDLPKMSRAESAAKRAREKHERSKAKIIGMTNGYIKVLKFDHWRKTKSRRKPVYLCKCKCGNKILLCGDLTYVVKSCGCLHKERMRSGENHPRALLKNEEVKAIRDLYASENGFRLVDLANMFHVNESYISNLVTYKTYKDI